MIRLTIVVGMLSAAVAAVAAPVSVVGTGYARGCFDAAERQRSAGPALRICDKALSDDGLSEADRAATLVNRGIVRMQGRRLVEAIADFDTVTAMRPDIAEAWVNKGIALMRMGKREAEAVTALSEGIMRNPLRPEFAYYQRGMANEDLGRVRDAYDDYSRAAALAPDWPDPAAQLQRFRTVRRKTLAG